MGTNINSDTTTNGIRVQVFPEFVQEHSDTDNNLFYFKYKIIITNNSDTPVTLISRHWEIINSEGDTEVVDGPGVIGKTPYLEPGEEFE
jgi:ApaG protein